ncbi:hypothetical protein QQS21_001444 [Conoideocrella luteorostrata]|uniref:Uncharacterized protein n=1 Tax=Conoideocrella luteorostrata TaxID=1105319 RepID=A0AAJ0CX56_9HYPO|nr:hypothetical protein QQS21_001444 [Conoideocrella luteorostrata]
MQFFKAIALFALQCHVALSSPTDIVAAECGAMGVMKVDLADVSADVDPSAIRKCAEHPLAASPNPVSKRDCWYGKSSGCSKGYCYKSCGGNGQWCWTAFNDGYGNWIGCQNDNQCSTNQACGIGNCKACGCSC